MIIHHYMTRYIDDEDEYYISWLQINIFGKSYCFSKRLYENGKRVKG